MKFKLDENFGTRTQTLFRDAGYDVHTVRDEALSGTSDQQLFEVCKQESRCIVTLDLDFANVVRFPPAVTTGIVVIRMPKNPSLFVLEQLIRQFLSALDEMSLVGQLWIVEIGRIRVHQSLE